ncbi:MAG: DUF6941 family protein [Candidatus Methylomirabilis sp.]
MKVTLLLCDNAQAVAGKLYILGGGWSIAGPGPVTMGIAVKVEVPWDLANRKHQFRVALVDSDDHPVMVPTPAGDQPLQFGGEFEPGRPAGLRAGTPLDVTFAVNLVAVPLPPDGRYVWRCFINEETHEDWQLAFSTRPAPKAGGPALPQ